MDASLVGVKSVCCLEYLLPGKAHLGDISIDLTLRFPMSFA